MEQMVRRRVSDAAGWSHAWQSTGRVTAEEKHTYSAAVQALRSRLDPGSKVLAAQDLRHAFQGENESVSDYILRVERCYQRAYGRDNLSVETREAILFGQLQDGMKFTLMQSPAVSGSQSYKDLCMTSRNEEKRLAELRRRQQYQKSHENHPPPRKPTDNPSNGRQETTRRPHPGNQVRKCYNCGSTEHLQKSQRRRALSDRVVTT